MNRVTIETVDGDGCAIRLMDIITDSEPAVIIKNFSVGVAEGITFYLLSSTDFVNGGDMQTVCPHHYSNLQLKIIPVEENTNAETKDDSLEVSG